MDATQRLLIGAVDGGEAYIFDEVVEAAILKGGELVVSDRSGTLRFYDSVGVWLRAYGSRGKGPGEYYAVRLVAETDSLLVFYDRDNHRLSWTTVAGAFLKSMPISAPGSPLGLGEDTMWLEQFGAGVDGTSTATYSAVELSDGTTTTQLALPGPRTEVTEQGGYTRLGFPEPWRRPLAAAHGPDLYLLVEPWDVVQKRGPSGSIATIAEVPPSFRPGPNHSPVLRVSPTGALWISGATSERLRPWLLLLPNGERRIVRLPSRFVPLNVYTAEAIGYERDENTDVQSVAVYSF